MSIRFASHPQEPDQGQPRRYARHMMSVLTSADTPASDAFVSLCTTALLGSRVTCTRACPPAGGRSARGASERRVQDAGDLGN